VRRAIRVPVEYLQDLVDAAPRANIAFSTADGVEAAPVAFRYQAGRYLIGVPRTDGHPMLSPGALVQLVIDDGRWFFDLRGISVRGHTAPADQAPEGAAASVGWFELTPEQVLAWDYATLRTAADDEP
jgi:hypothetical protein